MKSYSASLQVIQVKNISGYLHLNDVNMMQFPKYKSEKPFNITFGKHDCIKVPEI